MYSPGLTPRQRYVRARRLLADLGWKVALWPRWALALGVRPGRSVALPVGVPWVLPGRTVYYSAGRSLEDEAALLAHEATHARQAEAMGRWWWAIAYACGPVSVVAALAIIVACAVVGPGPCDAAAAFSCAASVLVWVASEDARRRAEVEAYAAAAVMRACLQGAGVVSPEHVGHVGAYGYRLPYMVGGSESALRRDVLAEARRMLRGVRR